jgi:hypothetical protein
MQLDAFRTHEVGGVDILLSLAFFANATIGTVSACLPFHTLPAVSGIPHNFANVLLRIVVPQSSHQH